MAAAFTIKNGVAIIPQGTTKIDDCAFYKCKKLESIVIPESVTEIGDYAFMNCHNLRSIHLPSSLKKIGRWCFALCIRLVDIEIPESVTEIGRFAFRGCRRDVTVLDLSLPGNTVSDSLVILESGFEKTIEFIDVYGFQRKLKVVFDKNGDYCSYGIEGISEVLPDVLGSLKDLLTQNYQHIHLAENNLTLGEHYEVLDWYDLLGSVIYIYYCNDEGDGIKFKTSNGKDCGLNWTYTCGYKEIEFMCGDKEPYEVESFLMVLTDLDLAIEAYKEEKITYLDDGFEEPDVNKLDDEPDEEIFEEILSYEFLTGLIDGDIPISEECYDDIINTVNVSVDQQGNVYAYNGKILLDLYLGKDDVDLADIHWHGIDLENQENIIIAPGCRYIEKEVLTRCLNVNILEIPESVIYIHGYNLISCNKCSILSRPYLYRVLVAWHSGAELSNWAFQASSLNLSSEFVDSFRQFWGDENDGNSGELSRFIRETLSGDVDIFTNNFKTLLYYSGKNGKDIPESVETIGPLAFALNYDGRATPHNRFDFESIVIPSSVKEICWGAFFVCTCLKSIVISNSVTIIGVGCFSNCYELVDVVLSTSLTEISDNLFRECKSLKAIVIPESVTKIGDGAFVSCTGLTNINIPCSVKKIGSYAFAYCTGLTSIDMGASVREISETAFMGCSALKTIFVPKGKTAFFHSILPSKLHALIEER